MWRREDCPWSLDGCCSPEPPVPRSSATLGQRGHLLLRGMAGSKVFGQRGAPITSGLLNHPCALPVSPHTGGPVATTQDQSGPSP